MGRPLRYLPYPGCLVEVTCRTFQGRKLLTPSAEVNDIVLGVLGRACSLYPEARLVAYQVLSNHPHLSLSPTDHRVLSEFMGHFEGNLAREVGGRLRGWTGKFWQERFRAIPVLDEASMEGRLKYLLSNGTKEGLVGRPADWPGVSCLKALLTGEPDEGTWHDRTAEYNARRRGERVEAGRFATRYRVELWPLPCWEGLSQAERAERVRAMVREIEEEAEERVRQGHGVLGVEGVLGADPCERPEELERRAAPLCHAASRAVRSGYRMTVRLVVEAFEAAAAAFAAELSGGSAGAWRVEFPGGTFRPHGGFVGMTESEAPS